MAFWNKIINWFKDAYERNKLVRNFNTASKCAFISGAIPTLLEAEITMGEPEWKHEYSKIFYSGFRIKASAGRELTRGEILEIGKVVLNNQTLSRQLYVLGWDTLEVIDMKTSKGCRWALKEFVKLGLMIDFGNNGFLNK